jgi:hypothetical protein
MTTTDIAALVADWMATSRNGLELGKIIRRWAEQSTAAGVPAERQVQLLAVCGIILGAGGRGGMGSGDLECPYCHAKGNGGHGGWCPNWCAAGIGDPATWVGAQAELQDQELPPISDYAWRILRYLDTCAEGRASAADVAKFGEVGETDRGWIFMELQKLEGYGLVKRDKTVSPYLWSVTEDGQAAMAKHGAP